ncbi:nucleoside deaminase [Isosphaeraceae bacterium EP7]
MPTRDTTDDLPESIRDRLPELMRAAVAQGRIGDDPFGCVLAALDDGRIVLEAGNSAGGDPTAHAEMNALRRAAERGLDPTSLALISTAEPCPMCMAASWWAKVPVVVFGTSIESLIRFGWTQVDLASGEILRLARGGPTIQLVGGVLTAETDPLYSGGPRSKARPGGHLPGSSGTL